jgi:hypothetical protein
LLIEAGDIELHEMFGLVEVLEPMSTEVAERDTFGQLRFDEGTACRRQQDLTAVAGRRDAGRAVDIEANVTITA